MSRISMGNPIDAAKQKVENVKNFEGNKNGKIDTREEVGILSVFLQETTDLTEKQRDYLSNVIKEANESIDKEEEKARIQRERAEAEETARQLGDIPNRIRELSNKNGYLAKDGAAELVRLLRSGALTETQANYIKDTLKNSGFDADNFDLTDVPAAAEKNTQFSVGASLGVGTYGATGNISAGMRVNNTYVDVSAGTGAADIIGGKVGHEWSLFNNKLGLNVYAGAQSRRSNNPTNTSISMGYNSTPSTTITTESADHVQDNGDIVNTTDTLIVNTPGVNTMTQTNLAYNSSDMRIGTGAMLTYQMGKRVKVGLGFEAGALRQTNANATTNFASQNETTGIDIRNEYVNGQLISNYPQINNMTSESETASFSTNNENSLRPYVTPTASMEIGLDKNNRFLLKAEGNLFEGRAGIQYNF